MNLAGFGVMILFCKLPSNLHFQPFRYAYWIASIRLDVQNVGGAIRGFLS